MKLDIQERSELEIHIWEQVNGISQGESRE